MAFRGIVALHEQGLDLFQSAALCLGHRSVHPNDGNNAPAAESERMKEVGAAQHACSRGCKYPELSEGADDSGRIAQASERGGYCNDDERAAARVTWHNTDANVHIV